MESLVDYITDGYWEDRGSGRRKFNVAPGGTLTANITALTSEGQQLAKWAMEAWTMVSGINFRLVSGRADITYDDNRSTAFSEWVVSGGTIISARVNVPASWLQQHGSSVDSPTFVAYLHETGHALGLGHAGNYDDDSANFAIHSISIFDSWQYSVMSYIPQSENLILTFPDAYPVTPQLADVLAIHELYGEPESINPGNTVYGYGSNTGNYLDEVARIIVNGLAVNSGAATIHDTHGVDRMDLRMDTTDQFVFMAPALPSSVLGGQNNLMFGLGTIIEEYVAGRGNDVIVGNIGDNYINGNHGDELLAGSDGNDTLTGHVGDDWLNGNVGNDRLYGAAGNDVLIGGPGRDVFIFRPNDGNYEDVIMDFDSGKDWIDLRAFTSIRSAHDLDLYWTDESRTTTLIDLVPHGGGEIILEGFTADMYNDDFLFA